MAGWEIRRLAPDEVDRVGAVLGLARLGGEAGVYLVAWEGGPLEVDDTLLTWEKRLAPSAASRQGV